MAIENLWGKRWIGVDFDGTLVENTWRPGQAVTPGMIGRNIAPMVNRVKRWIAQGKEVRILTARVSTISPFFAANRAIIDKWCQKNLGKSLPITCEKDPCMEELWDDRAVQLVPETGIRADELPRKPAPAEMASPVEDLMYEHSLLRRILAVFRWNLTDNYQPKGLEACADIVSYFIEDFHEPMEEKYIFPKFRAAGRYVKLVDSLQTQHRTGRPLTQLIRHATTSDASEVMAALNTFTYSYDKHASREDTVVFKAFKELVDDKELLDLAETFEHEEDDTFGEYGYDHCLESVEAVETELGIHDIDQSI